MLVKFSFCPVPRLCCHSAGGGGNEVGSQCAGWPRSRLWRRPHSAGLRSRVSGTWQTPYSCPRSPWHLWGLCGCRGQGETLPCCPVSLCCPHLCFVSRLERLPGRFFPLLTVTSPRRPVCRSSVPGKFSEPSSGFPIALTIRTKIYRLCIFHCYVNVS